MSRKLVSREEQRKKIIASGLFVSGEKFDVSYAAKILSTTPSNARQILGMMAEEGTVTIHSTNGRPGSGETLVFYKRRPVALILRKPWARGVCA